MNKKKGFTVLELVFAIFVIAIVAGAAMALTTRNLQFGSRLKEKFIAAYLAQEGMEIVRNMRDNNWLAGQPFADGFSLDQSCEADYRSPQLSCDQDRPLKIDANGFYSYDSGDETKFKRKIKLSQPSLATCAPGDSGCVLKVEVEVLYGGRSMLKTKEYLYDWY